MMAEVTFPDVKKKCMDAQCPSGQGCRGIRRKEKEISMKKFKVCRCNKCKKMVLILQDSPCPTMCCGEAMEVLEANTTDAALEKHVPDVTVDGDLVSVAVGSVLHPMLEEHFIQWIALVTEDSVMMQTLAPGQDPKAVFALNGKKAASVYEYCNLHGLWKKDL